MNRALIAGFWQRTLHFTEKIIVLLTVFYFINWIVSVLLILDAIHATGNFSYLDTLITETSSTFRDIVGIAIIKFAVENIFKYNDFGGRLISRSVPEEGAFAAEEVIQGDEAENTYAETEG